MSLDTRYARCARRVASKCSEWECRICQSRVFIRTIVEQIPMYRSDQCIMFFVPILFYCRFSVYFNSAHLPIFGKMIYFGNS